MWSHRTLVAPLTTSRRVAVALILCVASPLSAQDPITLLGTVRDYETGQPVVGARVAILGTGIMAETDGVGRYQLLNLEPGTYQVRIGRMGYGTLVEEIAVGPDSLTVAHFHLPVLATLLDRLTVRAAPTVRPAAERQTGFASSLGDVVDRAVPGVHVLRGSGQVGSGVRFRIRGIRSFTGRGAPLVYIDGVRVEYAQNAPAIAGLAGPSILDLIDPAMIERIDVVKGAEASVYGLGAANGVILITTKGRRSQP